MKSIIEFEAKDYHSFETYLRVLNAAYGANVYKYIAAGCDGPYHAIFYTSEWASALDDFLKDSSEEVKAAILRGLQNHENINIYGSLFEVISD